jgi:hypothetical protein
VLGNVWVSEYGAACVSFFTPTPLVSPTINTVIGTRNTPGNGFGVGSAALLDRPIGLALSSTGLYICDQGGTKIKFVTTNSPGSTFPSNYYVQTFPSVGLTQPVDIAVDKIGNLYVSDRTARKVFICLRRTSTWHVIAGTGASGKADGAGGVATFTAPGSMTVDVGGIVWLVDDGGLRRIRWTGGDKTLPSSWYVEKIPLLTNSAADGGPGVGGRTNITGVCTTRGGVVGFMDYGSLRRLDLTRK